jgi:hypothetical protein
MGTILGKKVYQPQHGRIMFRCPGCNTSHEIVVDGSRGWSWNSDGDKPTVSPSILCTWTRFGGDDAELDRILDEYKLPEDREKMLADKRITITCHSYIRDGQWQFLTDCTHSLSGQTVDIPDWPHGENY